MTGAVTEQAGTTRLLLAIAFAAGALIATALGVYGNVHDPTERSLVTLIFTETINAKVWIGTAAVVLAVFQVGSSLHMYGKLGRRPVPRWLPSAHRLSGLAAFLLSIPVAYHCLWALGFQDINGRVLIHSASGCLFYGALVTKIFFVRLRGLPGWALPVAGGAVFTTFIAVWLTSSLWFFTNIDFPGF